MYDSDASVYSHEISLECPLTQQFIEEKVIANFDHTAITKYVLSVPSYVNLPKYPAPWRPLEVTGHRVRSGISGDGRLFAHISIVEGFEGEQHVRRSEVVYREDEGWLLCVHYRDRYIVVLVNKYLYIYMNGCLLFMDWDISPRRIPLSLLYRAESAVRYLQVECEHYISLFTVFNAGCNEMGPISRFWASVKRVVTGNSGTMAKTGARQVGSAIVSTQIKLLLRVCCS